MTHCVLIFKAFMLVERHIKNISLRAIVFGIVCLSSALYAHVTQSPAEQLGCSVVNRLYRMVAFCQSEKVVNCPLFSSVNLTNLLKKI